MLRGEAARKGGSVSPLNDSEVQQVYDYGVHMMFEQLPPEKFSNSLAD